VCELISMGDLILFSVVDMNPTGWPCIEDLPLQYGESRHTACKFCQGGEQKKSRPTGMVLSGSRQDTTAAEEDK
jgi:hypothetical protein